MSRRRQVWDRMPGKFEELAGYNSRVFKGIVHTPEYVARMEQLQREFNTWAEEQRSKQKGEAK